MTEEIYEKFDAYNWDGDEAFKVSISSYCVEFANIETGVKKVLDLKNIPSDSPEAEPLTTKYKLFYFSKYILSSHSYTDSKTVWSNRPCWLWAVERT